MESGFKNPIDEAIRGVADDLTTGWKKFDEVPYDFLRKRLSVLARNDDGPYLMVTKGSVRAVLEVCTSCRTSDGATCAISEKAEEIAGRVQTLAEQGLRTLGVATREFDTAVDITRDDERDMVFEGLVVLFDPPKDDASLAVEDLRKLGVALKIITGDAAAVARRIVILLDGAATVMLIHREAAYVHAAGEIAAMLVASAARR